MPRIAKEFTAKAIEHLKPKPGATSTVYPIGGAAFPGLCIRVSANGSNISKHWMFRYTAPGTGHKGDKQRRREVSLGKYPSIGLREARLKASEFRTKIDHGIDPIEDREAQRIAAMAEKARSITFEKIARQYLDRKALEWKNPKDFPRWTRVFEKHAFPSLGKIPVSKIETADVVKIIEPLWTNKFPTAKLFRAHLENVFDMAMVHTNQRWANPASWKGHLQLLLPKVNRKGGNFAALHYADVPRFMKDLRHHTGFAARALEFVILCAARSGEVREATWDEIDWDNKLWTVPAERMKAKKAHTIPLSDTAVKLLESIPEIRGNNRVFPGIRAKQLSDMTLSKKIKDMHNARIAQKLPGYLDPRSGRIATCHGFRSAFKDWARAKTTFADEVSELALAHVSNDATRAAYARDALIDLRTSLMAQWAAYCIGN